MLDKIREKEIDDVLLEQDAKHQDTWWGSEGDTAVRRSTNVDKGLRMSVDQVRR